MAREITADEFIEIREKGIDQMYDATLQVAKNFVNNSKDLMSLGDFAVAVAYRAYCYGVNHGVHEASKLLYSDKVD